jgi:hypothetical protein
MNWMHINDNGDWECQHCCTSALMYESVPHNPDCPVILAEKKQYSTEREMQDVYCAHGETEESHDGIYCLECGAYLGTSEE